MSRRCLTVLTLAVATALLAGRIAGLTTPAEADRPPVQSKARKSFEALKSKMPKVVSNWLKRSPAWELADNRFKTEIKLARFTGPADAKISIALLPDKEALAADADFWLVADLLPEKFVLSVYLHYYDGEWTTVRVDGDGDLGKLVGPSLMLAIDRIGGN